MDEITQEELDLYDDFLSICLIECSKRWRLTDGAIVIEDMTDSAYDLMCYYTISNYCTYASRALRVKTNLKNRWKIRRKIKSIAFTKVISENDSVLNLKEEKDFFSRPLSAIQIKNKLGYNLIERIYNAYYKNLL